MENVDSVQQQKWKPNEEYLESLISMGIDKTAAEEALFCTGNASVEEAINYVFNTTRNQSDAPEGDGEEVRHYKMTFVVNTSLKMGKGKLAAQVAHACLGLYRDMLQRGIMTKALFSWEYYGEKKVVLQGMDHNHLQELYEKGRELNIPCYLIRDAGRTQIPPDSVTVLSLFGLEEDIDQVTGKLNLL